jgi:hypothetical protein
MARRPKPESEPARVRNLLALDAAAVVRRLEARCDEMIGLFSRLRNRAPLLSTIESRWASATFHDLAVLESREQAAASRFYDRLDVLRWYFTYTEDMPSTAQLTFTTLHRQLVEAHHDLVRVLGPPAPMDPPEVVVTEVVKQPPPAPPKALVRPRTRRRRRT